VLATGGGQTGNLMHTDDSRKALENFSIDQRDLHNQSYLSYHAGASYPNQPNYEQQLMS